MPFSNPVLANSPTLANSPRLTNRAEFGIYVHWPFCKAKCPYCDFNSHVRRGLVDITAFEQAFIRELRWFYAQTPDRRVSSIFFGGGTPSLMPPATVGRILEEITRLWGVSDQVEITLEANPTSVEAENFHSLSLAGVNRVSVGVQALNAPDLQALGRQHSPEEALAAFRLAQKIFPRVSFDLIYARPGQSLNAWEAELRLALTEGAEHMSLYQLTIEPETRYFDLAAAGKLHIPDEDLSVALFDLTQDMMTAAGLAGYEISNHAVKGHESRHNLLYWQYGEYIGVGPGAHSRMVSGDNRRAIMMEKHPETWASLVNNPLADGSGGIKENTLISPVDQATEYVLMGLRLHSGIDLDRFTKLASRDMNPKKIEELQAQGFIVREGSILRATAQGRRLLNALISALVLS